MQTTDHMEKDGSKRVKPKRGKNALTIFGIIAGVVLVIVSVIAFAIAKTGLVNVPLFSAFYHGPTPIRVISATPMSVSDFRILVGSRFLSLVQAGKRPPYQVQLSEEELTAVLVDAITQALRDPSWNVQGVQLAIRPTDLELYGHFIHGGTRVDLLAHVVPEIKDGGVSFALSSLRIGDYPISPHLGLNILGAIFSRDFGTFTLTFGDAHLTDLQLQDGSVTLTADRSREGLK